MKQIVQYDVAVIGGGPAGIMAAGRAGELGAKVILLEKNQSLGVKLLITGGGRCNITNDIENSKLFINSLGTSGQFLLSAFKHFGVREVKDFFESRGVKLKVEKNNQIFPVSNQAREILQCLLKYLQLGKIEIKFEAEVKKIIRSGNKIEKLVLTNGEEVFAKSFIIATGGKSYPNTGSTGDGYKWLKELNHQIINPRPGLTPILLKENWLKKVEGLGLTQAEISLYQGQKKVANVKGDLIFTAQGISGPAALDLSRYIKDNDLFLTVDSFPEIKAGDLVLKLQTLLAVNGKKILKNCLVNFIPPKLISVLGDLLAIDLTKKASAITKIERQKLVDLFKSFKLQIKSVGDYDRAVITVGGANLKEINSATMQSKLISNLFVVGELLDLDGPTGGYNLQICWSTGYLAGEKAALLNN